MDLRDLAHALRRWWLLVALLTWSGAAGSMLVTWIATPVYAAHIEVFVALRGTQDASAAHEAGKFAMERVKSYAKLVTTPVVTTPAIAAVGLPLTPDELARKLTATIPPDTVLVDIAVRDTNPERARTIAAAVGRSFTDAVAALETPAGSSSAPVQVTIVQPAAIPTSPASPNRTLNLGLGLLVGVSAGLAAALLRETLDAGVKDPAELPALAGCTVMGVVQFDRDARRTPLAPLAAGRSPRAEDYRSLRTNLGFAGLETPPRVIVVTSALAREGKTVTACNLALALASAGQRTILLDGDLHGPAVAGCLGLEPPAGLADVITGRSDLTRAIQPWRDAHVPLQVVTAGTPSPNPSELLDSPALARTLDRLSRDVDAVVVDAPPLLAVTDAAVLARSADYVLVVVRYGTTRPEQVRRAVETLRGTGVTALGAVLNMVPSSRSRPDRDPIDASSGKLRAVPMTAGRPNR